MSEAEPTLGQQIHRLAQRRWKIRKWTRDASVNLRESQAALDAAFPSVAAVAGDGAEPTLDNDGVGRVRDEAAALVTDVRQHRERASALEQELQVARKAQRKLWLTLGGAAALIALMLYFFY